MNHDIEKLYRELYSWLVQPNSCVPDVEIGAVFDWIDGKKHLQGKNKISPDVANELSILRDCVYNPRSGCPDVEIGFIIDWMRNRIATHLNITEKLDAAIIGELWFNPQAKAALANHILWSCDLFIEHSEEDMIAYIDLLIESCKITDDNGTLSLNRKTLI